MFILPQFNVLKSNVQQFLKLVFAKEDPSQWNINPKLHGSPYTCTQNKLNN